MVGNEERLRGCSPGSKNAESRLGSEDHKLGSEGNVAMRGRVEGKRLDCATLSLWRRRR